MDQFLDLDAMTGAGVGSSSSTVLPGDEQGMLFQDMFQQYLAPDLAKSAPSATPIASTSELPFASASNDELSFSNASFDPRTFLPTLPGSPIGAFSPSSDNSGQRYNSLSPLSFPDLDASADSSAWSLDPSLFTGTITTSNSTTDGTPVSLFGTSPSLLATTTSAEFTSSVAALAGEPASVAAPVVTPAASTRGTRASAKQAKRQHSVSVKGEDDEDEQDDDEEEDSEDEEMDSDDSSSTHNTRASKKSRSTASNSRTRSKSARTSVAAYATKELHHTTARSNLPPVPEWTDKPDPETYKKLSSKEKRQLRNKISARNFRHRRKEQLTSLEDEISSRESIISQLREEVGTMRTENTHLRSEVSMLKAKWDEMMEKMTAFQVPQSIGSTTAATGLGVNPRRAVASASNSSVSTPEDEPWALDSPQAAPSPLPPVASGSRRGTRASNGITKPNMTKDVAPSLGARRSTSSWTTQNLSGGFTSVHTTLLPEPAASLSQKALPAMFQQHNFNPALNNVSASHLAQYTQHLRDGNLVTSQESATGAPAPKGKFEDFFGSNPYWLRPENVEEYRSQLYGKVAHNTAGLLAAQKLASSQLNNNNNNSSLPMPSGFRPAFFTTSSASNRFAPPSINGGKEPRDVAPTTDLLEFQSPRTALAQQQATALVASLATQTLFSRMTSAFVDAFVGTDGTQSMDANKVADVLAGRASVQVVPRESSSSSAAAASVSSLGLQLGALDLSNDASSSRSASPSPRPHCSWEEMRKKWCN